MVRMGQRHQRLQQLRGGRAIPRARHVEALARQAALLQRSELCGVVAPECLGRAWMPTDAPGEGLGGRSARQPRCGQDKKDSTDAPSFHGGGGQVNDGCSWASVLPPQWYPYGGGACLSGYDSCRSSNLFRDSFSCGQLVDLTEPEAVACTVTSWVGSRPRSTSSMLFGYPRCR